MLRLKKQSSQVTFGPDTPLLSVDVHPTDERRKPILTGACNGQARKAHAFRDVPAPGGFSRLFLGLSGVVMPLFRGFCGLPTSVWRALGRGIEGSGSGGIRLHVQLCDVR